MPDPSNIPQSGQRWWLGWSPKLVLSPTVLTFNLDDGSRWLTIRAVFLEELGLRKTLWADGKQIVRDSAVSPETWASAEALALRIPFDALLIAYLRNPTEIALAALKQEFERG